MATRLHLTLIFAVLMLGVGYVAWYTWMTNNSSPMPPVEERYSCKSVCVCVFVSVCVCVYPHVSISIDLSGAEKLLKVNRISHANLL